MEFLLAIIAVVVLVAAFVLYSSLSWGFVCYQFYHWFILPVFTDLPELNYTQAVGLMLFITLFKNHSSNKKKGEEEDSATNVTWVILSPWIVLAVGYLVLSTIIK